MKSVGHRKFFQYHIVTFEEKLELGDDVMPSLRDRFDDAARVVLRGNALLSRRDHCRPGKSGLK